MKPEFPENPTSNPLPNSTSRRQFLAGAGALGGAIVLGQSAFAQDVEKPETAPPVETAPQLVLKLNDNPELGKVGGWKIFEWGDDSVIVANTDAGMVACSAICTHKGCEVEYHHADKLFICPCHNARFDMEGKVVRGPAKTPLKKYDAAQAIVVANPK